MIWEGSHVCHNSPAKSPALRGPTESHSHALYKSKFHRGMFAPYHKPGIGTAGELERSLTCTLAPLALYLTL